MINDSLLQVPIPAGLGAGVKDIRVANPGGGGGGLPGALRIGRAGYLPVVGQ